MSASPAVDFDAIKQIQQRVWADGDFSMIAVPMVIVGEQLAEAADIVPGERVLDVACGNGNATIAAARRAQGNTVGVDYVPSLLEHGRERARAERLDIEYLEGDAERIPVPNASFDVVLSTFGCMFAPDQEGAASELLRVCRPGGRIAMANWTPESFPGQMFKLTATYAPPPPGVQPPSLWGTEERLRELFGDGISSLETTEREFTMRFRSADEFVEYFRSYFGPVKTALDRLDESGAEGYIAEMKEMLRRFDRGGERAVVAPAEYLEVVATRA